MARETPYLDRIVTIPILPPRFPGRAELYESFGREVRVVASVNHVYIYPLHDIIRINPASYPGSIRGS